MQSVCERVTDMRWDQTSRREHQTLFAYLRRHRACARRWTGAPWCTWSARRAACVFCASGRDRKSPRCSTCAAEQKQSHNNQTKSKRICTRHTRLNRANDNSTDTWYAKWGPKRINDSYLGDAFNETIIGVSALVRTHQTLEARILGDSGNHK